MWTVITGLFKSALGWVTGSAAKLWLYGGIVAAAVGVVLVAWLKARSDGANAEKVRQQSQVSKAIQERRNAEDTVRRMPDSAVHDELRRDWSRD